MALSLCPTFYVINTAHTDTQCIVSGGSQAEPTHMHGEVDKGDDLWFNFALSSGSCSSHRQVGATEPCAYGQIVRIQWANSTWFEHASELNVCGMTPSVLIMPLLNWKLGAIVVAFIPRDDRICKLLRKSSHFSKVMQSSETLRTFDSHYLRVQNQRERKF
jgi:hypothetical protein